MKHQGIMMFAGGLVIALCAGWLAFPALLYQKIDQPLQFSHKIHAGEKVGLACEECHSFRSDGSFTGIPSLEKCSTCHAAQIGETPEEKILVEQYVTKGVPIPWKVYARQPQNTFFSHVQHVKFGAVPCERCHGPHAGTESLPPFERNRISGYSRAIWGPNISGLKSHEWEGMKMDDCSHCHAERGVQESCLACHK